MIDRRTEATRRDLRDAFEENFRLCAVGGCLAHPTVLSRELYERAHAEGFNMLGYIVGTPFAPSTEPRWPCAAPYMSGHQIQTRFNPE